MAVACRSSSSPQVLIVEEDAVVTGRKSCVALVAVRIVWDRVAPPRFAPTSGSLLAVSTELAAGMRPRVLCRVLQLLGSLDWTGRQQQGLYVTVYYCDVTWYVTV